MAPKAKAAAKEEAPKAEEPSAAHTKYVCMYVCNIYIYMYMFLYIYTYVCIYIYAYVYGERERERDVY